ncbi:MAG: hypothetical protein ACXVAE_07615 [Candidatus Limnocylindrales bacterium]
MTEPEPSPAPPAEPPLVAPTAEPPVAPPAEPSRAASSRPPLGLLLVLGSIIVAVVGLATLWQQPGFPGTTASAAVSPPSATPGGTAAATSAPTASTTPGAGSVDPAISAAIEQVEREVPPLRGLQPTAAVPERILSAQQLVAELEQRFREENPHALLVAQGAFLARLGLLPAGTDLEALQLQLDGSQVIGFYDDKTKTLNVVQRGGTFGPLERSTVAHEYTHALQDQHFGLARLGTDDLSNGDRAGARLALAEGDATLVMQDWTLRLSAADQLQLLQQSSDPKQLALLASMPPYLVQQLLFPYQRGLAFVTALQAQGGWAAVDAAYARPPDSSSQILHPELYAAKVEPVTVDVGAPSLVAALDRAAGSGWTASYQDTIGEFSLGQWLQRGAGADGAASVVGWRGDRAVYLEGPGGHWYLVIRTTFDTGDAAARFHAAAEASVRGLAASSAVTTAPDGRTVTVTLADVPLVQP